jgi:hypothetical protein
VSQIQYPYPEVHIVDWMAGVEWERERIIKLLMDRAFWLVHLDKLAEAEELKLQATVIKGEQK